VIFEDFRSLDEYNKCAVITPNTIGYVYTCDKQISVNK